MRKQTKNILKWIVYIVTLLVLFIMQTTPGLFQIFGTRPILGLPFAVCLSMFETEKTAAVLGALAGGLWDISSGKLLAISECSNLPDMNAMFRDNAVWSFFGLWYAPYLGEYTDNNALVEFYNSEAALTREDYTPAG